MAISFPSSPSTDDVYLYNGVKYIYDGTKWISGGQSFNDANYVQASGDTITGNLTLNADLTVNTDTLYVDTTNDRVGINTASPSEALDIQGGLLINGANVTAVLSGSIADDAFYSLDLTAAGFMLGGLAAITTFSTYDIFSQSDGTGIFYYDCGNSIADARILVDAGTTTSIEGGTTSTSTTITDFTDDRVTIICNSNTLRIANRTGATRIFKLTFL